MLLSEIYMDTFLCPSFIFTGEEIQIDSAEEAEKWIAVLEDMLSGLGVGARALIWKNSLRDGEKSRIVELSSSGTRTLSQTA